MPAAGGGIVVVVVGGSDRPGCCCCGDGAACVGCCVCGGGAVSNCSEGGGSDDTSEVADGDSTGLAGSVIFVLGSIIISVEKSIVLRSTIEPLLIKKGTLE